MEFKFAFRNLTQRLFLNLIKSAGLGMALTGIILILLYIKSEVSFDRFHKNSDRIFRLSVTNSGTLEGKHFARVYMPGFVPAMANFFSGIENYVRLVPVRGGVLKHKEKFIRINQGFQCDSTFFKVFDAELLTGNPDHILDQPATMIVTESFARKVFGNLNPVGQTLTLPSGQFYGENTDFIIRGIMKDYDRESHFHPDFITTPHRNDVFNDWAWTYLLLQKGRKTEEIKREFVSFFSKYYENSPDTRVEAHLQPIRDIHLYSDKLREIEPNGNLFVIFTLTSAALVLFFISLINYINLNTGMAAFSEQYLYISKVFGSFTRVNYYFAEGIIVYATSVFLGAIFTGLAHILLLRYFSLDLIKGNWLIISIIILLFGFVSILAGLLPVLKPQISRMRGNLRYHAIRKGTGKSLLVIQYAISAALMISVLVMIHQTNYALKMGMGENRTELICLEDLHTDIQSEFGIFKQELLTCHSVKSVTAMLDPPGGEANDMFMFEAENITKNAEESRLIGVLPCDYSFADVFGLKFLAGDDFSPGNIDSEGSGEYIINKAALKMLGYSLPDDIIGKSFKLLFDSKDIIIPSGNIIGVVNDFNLSGIKKKVEPLVLFKRNDIWLINFVISAEPGMENQAIADIERVWKKLFPDHPFGYRYVSSIYRHVYRTEILQSRLLLLFTIINILISSMGLLGLSLLTTQRRTKEIGIRVVNGATAREILVMLNWYFLKWILLSFFIAIPLSWFAMNKWLENFAYKTSLEIWIFGLAGIVTLLFALLTVSFQSWKSATRNPVESLRYQ